MHEEGKERVLTNREKVLQRVSQYRFSGYNKETYLHPDGAILEVWNGKEEVKILSPNIGGVSYNDVKARIDNIHRLNPDADIYITIPSKANRHH